MSAVDHRPRPASLARRSLATVERRETNDAVVVAYSDFALAEAAVHRSAAAGLDVARLSIVWRAGASDGVATGFHGPSDVVRFWEACGGLWSGVDDLPLGGVMVTIPRFGAVLIGGRLAFLMVTALHHLEVGGAETLGLGALGAALAGLGLPHDDLPLCRHSLEGGFVLVVGDGPNQGAERTGKLLCNAGAHRASAHTGAARAAHLSSHPPIPVDHSVLDRASPADDATSQEFR